MLRRSNCSLASVTRYVGACFVTSSDAHSGWQTSWQIPTPTTVASSSDTAPPVAPVKCSRKVDGSKRSSRWSGASHSVSGVGNRLSTQPLIVPCVSNRIAEFLSATGSVEMRVHPASTGESMGAVGFLVKGSERGISRLLMRVLRACSGQTVSSAKSLMVSSACFVTVVNGEGTAATNAVSIDSGCERTLAIMIKRTKTVEETSGSGYAQTREAKLWLR